MGTLVSVPVVNTVMVEIENQVELSTNYDEVMHVIPENKVDDILIHINTLHSSIKFICVQETITSITL